MEGILDGQVCIITGASRGIGLAIGQRFLREGAKIYGLSRSKPDGSPVGGSHAM